jgi:ATP-binding cassette subfamily G (WHITE) protein 2
MSGLDSTSMSSMMHTLRQQAENNVAVLLTIHQPSTYVFYQFDWILFLGGRGRVVYWGKPADCMGYLASLDFHPMFGPNCNPSDFLMDLVCMYILVPDGRTAFQFLVDTWEENSPQPQKKSVTTEVAADHPKNLLKRVERSFTKSRSKWEETASVEYTTTFSVQLQILCQRTSKTTWEFLMSRWRLFEGIILSVMSGIIWFQTPYEEDTVATRTGYFFFVLTSFFYASVFSGVQCFSRERFVYIKETRAAQYSPAAYYVSKLLVEGIFRLILPFAYMMISFMLVSINPHVGYAICLVLVMLMIVLIGEAIGGFIGILILDLQEAITVASILCATWLLVGGFYTTDIPSFIKWLSFSSPLNYAFQACLQCDFSRRMPCNNGFYVSDCFYIDENGYYKLRESLTGPEILDYYGVNHSLGFNFFMLLVFLLIFRILAYIALVLRRHNRTTDY